MNITIETRNGNKHDCHLSLRMSTGRRYGQYIITWELMSYECNFEPLSGDYAVNDSILYDELREVDRIDRTEYIYNYENKGSELYNIIEAHVYVACD
jgi:hypothetical protein